jgi:hypothetical protein
VLIVKEVEGTRVTVILLRHGVEKSLARWSFYFYWEPVAPTK